jgi:hypothetical protein
VRLASHTTLSDSDLGIRFNEKGFSGNLASLSLIEVVQTLAQCLKTGKLIVKQDEFETEFGTIFFTDGEITHAEFKNEFGFDAVLKILNMPSGSFDFYNDVTCQQQSIDQSTMSIMLEACRIRDETQREETHNS